MAVPARWPRGPKWEFGMCWNRYLQGMSIAVCLLIGVAGCSTTDPLEEMGVTLTNIEFKDATLFEAIMVATIRVSNPNPESFEFEGASFKLILDDRKVGTGLAPDAFSVDRLGTTTVDVTFHINTATAVFRVIDVLKDQREVNYGIQGSLFVTSSYGRKKLKVNKMGTLDLKNLDVPQSIEPDSILPPAPSS